VILLHMLNHVISGAMPIIYPDLMDEFNIGYGQLGLVRSVAGLSAGFPRCLSVSSADGSAAGSL